MLKKLKSLFIIEDGTTSENTETESPVTRENNTNTATDPVVNRDFAPVKNLEGGPDPKFVDVLLKAIEAANKEGFDYLEYKTSLQSLQKMDMDEATRFKSAFAMAKTMGLTKEKLIGSTEHYIAVLNNEEKKFKDALINQKARQVSGREDKLKSIEKSIAEKAALIDKLKAEMEAGSAELNNVRAEISEAVEKIDMTNAQFMHAMDSVLNQIKDDMSKIRSYID
ncbi:MAG: hypothetical protein IPM42_02735 [Saprospiraceae bacterium]|nr:hypothetical protein [Saprospiraceae bacterium]